MWFYSGGMCGFIRGQGACMVLFRGRGVHGFIQGACMVLFGEVHGFIWGVRGFIWGACVVLCRGVWHGFIRGCAWFYSGGSCVVLSGGCMVLSGGACVVLFGGMGHVWFYLGGRAWFYLGEGMHGFIWGRVWFYSGGAWFYLGGVWFYLGARAWFYGGGVHGFIRGVCMVLFGGSCVVLSGGCMVLSGRHVWFYLGEGACVVLSRGGGVRDFSSFFGYNEIRSMSGRYASYWNAFLFNLIFVSEGLDVLLSVLFTCYISNIFSNQPLPMTTITRIVLVNGTFEHVLKHTIKQ